MMDKGIRQGVVRKFGEMVPQLKDIGGKKFRRTILDWTVAEFACSMAAASTHYNHAFQEAKKAIPDQIVGLGRPPEKNNGGRKKKAIPAQNATPDSGTVADVGESNILGNSSTEEATQTLAANIPQLAASVPTLFKVLKKSDNSVVAEGLTKEQAEEMVALAKAKKKAALILG